MPTASSGQWNMSIVGVYPSIDWRFQSQAPVVLDNGDIWVVAQGGTGHIQLNVDEDVLFFSKLTPDGFVRYTPGNGESLYDWVGNLGVPATWFNGGGKVWESEVNTGDANTIVSYGNKIFFGTWWWQLFEFDTLTNDVNWVAGRIDNFTGKSTDAFNGRDAKEIDGFSQGALHDGYYYFWDRESLDTGLISQAVLRRILLQPPYTVETIAGDTPNYNLVASGSAWLTWLIDRDINGIPNGLNTPDSYVGGHRPNLCIYDGYIYMFDISQSRGVRDGHWGFRRVALADPVNTHELLYYGLSDKPPKTYFSEAHNYEGFLEGDSTFTHPPYKGVTEYEGLDIPDSAWGSGTVLSDGTWLLVNYSSGYNSSSQQYGGSIIAISLPELVADFQANGGPVLFDRNNPKWKTVANGSHQDEDSSDWSDNVRDRAWNFRVGNKPLFTHPMPPGLVSNPNSPHGDAVFFLTPNKMQLTEDQFLINPSTAFLCKLERGKPSGGGADSGFSMDVNLVFEGLSLKGYTNAFDVSKTFAQREVFLQ